MIAQQPVQEGQPGTAPGSEAAPREPGTPDEEARAAGPPGNESQAPEAQEDGAQAQAPADAEEPVDDDETEAAADPEERSAKLEAALARAEEAVGVDDFGVFDAVAALCSHEVRRGRHAEAEALARRMLALLERHRPEDSFRLTACWHFLGQLLSMMRRDEDAAAFLREAIRGHVRRRGWGGLAVARVLLDLAEIRYRQGTPRRARALLRRALEAVDTSKEPDGSEALDVRGRAAAIHERGGDLERALTLYRRALRRCARGGEEAAAPRRKAEEGLCFTLDRLGRARLDAGRLAEAQVLAEELTSRDAALGYPLLSEIHEAAGRPREVQRTLEAAVRALPQDYSMWGRLADVYAAAGLHGEAADAYDKALRCPDTDAAFLHYRAGLSSQHNDRPLQALGHFEQVRRDDIDEGDEHLYWQARSRRLLLLRHLGRTPEAAELAAEIAAELPATAELSEDETPAALVCLGRALLYLRGDRAAARTCAQQAFRRSASDVCLGLLREIEALPVDPGRTRCLRIIVRVERRDPESGALRARTRTYAVQANSLEEGLSFLLPLEEAPDGDDDLAPAELLEWSRIDVTPVGLRGVGAVSGYRDAPELPHS